MLFSITMVVCIFVSCASPSGETKYSISYDPNGATLGEAPVDVKKYALGEKIVVAAPGTMGKIGHGFSGWSRDKSGTVLITPGQSITMDDPVLILYAQWHLNTYTLSFDKNSPDATGTMDTLSIVFGESTELPLCLFVKEEYSFSGWALTATGSKAYSNGAEYQQSSGENQTLYCLWEPSTAQQQIDVSVNLGAEPVLYSGTPMEVQKGETLQLVVTGNYAHYSWTLDGTELEQASQAISIDSQALELTAGIHRLFLIVTDAQGEKYSTEIQIKVIN